MSRSRRGATGIRGVLLVDKPSGMTSHDVVSVVRRITGERRVGHAGTLDPMATGLLVVLVGPYTRLEPHLSTTNKTYIARITFGTETDTDDTEGEVINKRLVPPGVFDPQFASDLLVRFVGSSLQQPPQYSALKVGGRTAHRVARAGGSLELAPREIVVHEASLIDCDADNAWWSVRFSVSKGTYVRALARDIGRAAGSCAHLSALRRTASGVASVADAVSLSELEATGDVTAYFRDPVEMLGLPTTIGPVDDVAHGRPFSLGDPSVRIGDGPVAVLDDDGLSAIYSVSGDRATPLVVFPARVVRESES